MNETAPASQPKCPVCSVGALVREVRVSRFEYRGETLTYDQPGDWCTECGEAVLTGEDMAATEQLILDFIQRMKPWPNRSSGLTKAVPSRSRGGTNLRREDLDFVQDAPRSGGKHRSMTPTRASAARPRPTR